MKCEPENSRRGEALRSTLLLECRGTILDHYELVSSNKVAVSMPNHVPIALDDLRRVWRHYETLQHT